MLDRAANGGTMVAFCAPEGGPMIAAAIAGGQSILDIIFLFAGDIPQQPAYVSQPYLDASFKRIPELVTEGSRETDSRHAFVRIAQFNDVMSKHWKDADQGCNPAFIGTFAQPQMDTLAEPLDEMSADGLLSHLDTLEMSAAENAVRALHVYIYGVTTFLLLVKINSTWEYAKILRAHKVAAGNGAKLKNDADNLLTAWKARDPSDRGPRPKMPAPLADLLSADEISRTSPYIHLIKPYLPDMTTCVRDQHQAIKGHFGKAENAFRVASNAVSPVMPDANGTFFFLDTAAGTKKEGYKTLGAANLARQAYLGTLRAGLFDRYVFANGADIYDNASLAKILTICDGWDGAVTDATGFLKTIQDKGATIAPSAAPG